MPTITTTKGNPPVILAILAWWCLAVAFQVPSPASGFVAIRTTGTRTNQPPPSAKLSPRTNPFAVPVPHFKSNPAIVSIRSANKQNNNSDKANNGQDLEENEGEGEGDNNNDATTVTNNFDGEGFANYLLPYAIALIGSVLATAAMFKFVLLDY